MRSLSRLLTLSVLLTGLSLGPAVSASAQSPLTLGAGTVSGTATSEAPAVYTLTLPAAGVLTVAVNGTDDLTMSLADSDGQVLPEGTTDRDLNGNTGTEILSVVVGVPGEYRVSVSVFGSGTSEFEIAGSFLAFPAFAREEDPDGKPSQAQALEVGASHDDSLNTADGDMWDWFVLEASADATLAIITRAADGNDIDLMLEVFVDGDFETPVDSSDQDQQGDTANEAVTVVVAAGQKVHVRVGTPVGEASGPYRISSSPVGAR